MFGIEFFSILFGKLRQERKIAEKASDASLIEIGSQWTPEEIKQFKENQMPTWVMGKTTEEWSKLVPAPEYHRIFAEQDWAALLKWANREKPMTREEARKKIEGITTVSRNEWLDVLEALGLIKFEEEKKEDLSPSLTIRNVLAKTTIYGAPMKTAVDCINALYEDGYRIVKKDYTRELSMVGYKVVIDLLDYRLIPDYNKPDTCQVIGRLNKIERTG